MRNERRVCVPLSGAVGASDPPCVTIFLVSQFVELFVTLLPADAGGRTSPVAPRYGTYRPFVRTEQGDHARVRFLEGPPQIGPGEGALVVAEFEDRRDASLFGGDLDLIEPDERRVGIVTVLRVMRPAISA